MYRYRRPIFQRFLLLIASTAALENDFPYPTSTFPASFVHVVSTQNMSHEDVISLQTLSGLLARTTPSIYVVNSDPNQSNASNIQHDMTMFWLKDLKSRYASRIKFSDAHVDGDLSGLFKVYRSNITGYVWFDSASNSTNAAVNYCAGSMGGVVAVGSSKTMEYLRSMGIPMLANLSGVDPYDTFVEFRHSMNNRVAVFQPDDGSKAECLTAYAVFAKCPIVEHPPGGSLAFDAVLANFAKDKLNAGFGWTSWDEHEFTAKITAAGGIVHASDFLHNLEVLSNLPPPNSDSQIGRKRETRTSDDSNVHTVSFIMSDGDNLQLIANGWMSDAFFGSPVRNSMDAIPMGWSFSPATAVLMPSILDYVRRNMSSLDSLSAGPSGMGYVYPQLFGSEDYRRIFARATGELMRSCNMSLLNVIGVTPSVESVRALADASVVDGVIYFTFGRASDGYAGMRGNVDFVDGTPVVGLRLNLWDEAFSGVKVGVEGLVHELQKLPKGRGDVNAYSVIVVHMGSHNYTSAAKVVKLLEQDGGFDVVLPETLINRIRSLNQTTCALPTGTWSEHAGDLPKCGMSGTIGSCRFSCSGINRLDIPVACDLDVCSNMTLSPSRLDFLCSETGSACAAGHF